MSTEEVTPLTLALFGARAHLVEQYADKLVTEGEVRGLIGPREKDRIWARHIVNSAALLGFLPKEGSVIDVGSGAGLPGIVIAIARPDLAVTLVEPMERRTLWLSEVVDELGLENVEVVRGRAQDLPSSMKAKVVTARAVAGLGKLLRMTHRLVAEDGSLLALKGRRAGEEVRASRRELASLGFWARVEEVVSVLDGDVTFVVECTRK